MALGGSVAMMRINAKATPINDNDNNFHIMTMELVWPIVWGSCRATSRHWLLMVSGEGVFAHACRRPCGGNFGGPGVRWPACLV